MKVILIQDVDGLGMRGDVVSVKNGYGRNFLIPQKLAVLATPGALKANAELAAQQAQRREEAKTHAEGIAAKLEAMELAVGARVGEDNRIFGTITSQQVALGLAEQGIEVDRRKISLDDEIRLVGVYAATVKLHPEVTARVKVRVEPMAEAEQV